MEAAIRAALAASQQGSERAPEMAERLIGIAGIAGIALVDAAGCPMTMTGRSDYALDANRGGGTAGYQKLGGEVLVLRVLVSIAEATAALSLVETPELGGMTTGFLWRIADLIGLMAAVVTAATMLVLHFVILERLDALGGGGVGRRGRAPGCGPVPGSSGGIGQARRAKRQCRQAAPRDACGV